MKKHDLLGLKEKKISLTIRIPNDLKKDLEELKNKIKKNNPGYTITMNHLIISALRHYVVPE